MKTSINRMQAIFIKDFKDVMKNMFISSSLLMPIILAFMYSRLDDVSIDLIYLIVNLSFVAVAFLIQCSMIAEEKEKNTLRSLMLSPASVFEILAGKSALTFLMTGVTIVVSIKLMDYVPGNSLIVIVAILISTLFYIILGTLFGLITKSVMEASVMSMPFMVIFGFASLFENIAASYKVSYLIDYLPNMQLIEIARMDEVGTTFLEVIPNLLIILAWIAAAAVVTVSVFKKKEMND
ncbi:MAG TPA: ABC transporter permease [Bacillota bacterium]|nr:ABC transporter permease [Bacillota bacterium]